MSAIDSAMEESPRPEETLDQDLLQHCNALYRYALVRVGDRNTAEDLVQDALVTAVDKISEFSGRSSLRTWLIGILRHKILDHYRGRKRHPEPESLIGEPAPGDDDWFTTLGVWREDPNVGLDMLDGDPGKAAERSELRAILQFCIDHLPERLHRIFVLRELEEMGPAETCELAGISRKSLAVFMYRARESLRTCLQEKWL